MAKDDDKKKKDEDKIRRANILSKIRTLEAEKAKLESQKAKYDALLTKAGSVVSELTRINNLMLIMNESLKSNFSLNGKTADSNKVMESSNLVSEAVTSFNSQIIPEINKSISKLTSQIQSKDAEIQSYYAML